jgi:hypothetical protein
MMWYTPKGVTSQHGWRHRCSHRICSPQADEPTSSCPLPLKQSTPHTSPSLSIISHANSCCFVVVVFGVIVLPHCLSHLLLVIATKFFRRIVELTLAVLLHKVAGQSLQLHRQQWRLQIQGDCNDRICGLVGFILLINCCISLLGNHNDGVNLYDVCRTPVLLENWHTVTYRN